MRSIAVLLVAALLAACGIKRASPSESEPQYTQDYTLPCGATLYATVSNTTRTPVSVRAYGAGSHEELGVVEPGRDGTWALSPDRRTVVLQGGRRTKGVRVTYECR